MVLAVLLAIPLIQPTPDPDPAEFERTVDRTEQHGDNTTRATTSRANRSLYHHVTGLDDPFLRGRHRGWESKLAFMAPELIDPFHVRKQKKRNWFIPEGVIDPYAE